MKRQLNLVIVSFIKPEWSMTSFLIRADQLKKAKEAKAQAGSSPPCPG